jgi:hypothetical protein
VFASLAVAGIDVWALFLKPTFPEQLFLNISVTTPNDDPGLVMMFGREASLWGERLREPL